MTHENKPHLTTRRGFIAATAIAQTAAQHTQHHPVTVAQAPAAKGALAPMSGASSPMASMAAMDERMKAMSAMHEKMVNAKTAEERNALMAEHMKTMQDGMAIMNQMGGMGMSGMGMSGMSMGAKGMAGKAGAPGAKAMPGHMAEHHQMMEKRMDMMQSMMQMMMDRMPAAPAK